MRSLPSLEDKTDIRVSDDIAGPGNDICIPCLTHVDVPDDFPNVSEVHLSLENANDTTGESLYGNGHCHVRLRAAHEIDRAKKRYPLLDLQKTCCLGIIRLFVGENGSKPSYVKSRGALNVDGYHFRYCRREVEQFHEFKLVFGPESFNGDLLAEADRFHLPF